MLKAVYDPTDGKRKREALFGTTASCHHECKDNQSEKSKKNKIQINITTNLNIYQNEQHNIKIHKILILVMVERSSKAYIIHTHSDQKGIN